MSTTLSSNPAVLSVPLCEYEVVLVRTGCSVEMVCVEAHYDYIIPGDTLDWVDTS